MSEMTQQPMTAADMKELLRSRYGGENKKIIGVRDSYICYDINRFRQKSLPFIS